MAIKLKHHHKISLFLYVLFLTSFYFWIYLDRKYSTCAATDLAKNTNSGCFIYKDASSFCFVSWIVILIMLLFFITNNVMKNGIKALKKPVFTVLATAILYFIAEFCFMVAFKK
ncbi:MAG TPA: hypothetical protein VNX01_07930 [Bacteroidia bacterium]|nr:hypothetical protein [Bacteroidia bacterium]